MLRLNFYKFLLKKRGVGGGGIIKKRYRINLFNLFYYVLIIFFNYEDPFLFLQILIVMMAEKKVQKH